VTKRGLNIKYYFIIIYYMLSQTDKDIIYKTIKLSNMRVLKRKYNYCKYECTLPIQCTFNIKPTYYKIIGNYGLSSNEQYNTILTFTEDCVVYTYITLKVYITIALQSDPSTIISENTFIQTPGKYQTPAGTDGLIIKSYFNLPNC